MSDKSKKTFRIVTIIICALVVLWVMIIGTDYWRTIHSFEKPIFSICTLGVDDGGSGTYTGLGYNIEIKGNFMPEDELPGVTHARFIMFGRELKKVIRD